LIAPTGGVQLILASRSPQRRAILTCMGVPFEVRASDVAELACGEPHALTVENARRKALAARREQHSGAVVGCDTVVVLDGTIYGKPADAQEARATLGALAGRTHEVVSGVALLLPDGERTATACTAVSFRELSPALIDSYVASGEWRERAGGYAIQGAGAALVRSIAGEYENVVGLPVATLIELYPELLTA
jgi:septum formation protein